jgi:hypothetical protein
VQAANTSVTDILDCAYEKAFWGLPALVDDGTNRDNYFGILRSQAESLKSYVVGSVGAMSLDVAQRTSDVVYQKLGGIIDKILMHHSVRREYIKLLNDDRRYMGSDLKSPDGAHESVPTGRPDDRRSGDQVHPQPRARAGVLPRHQEIGLQALRGGTGQVHGPRRQRVAA